MKTYFVWRRHSSVTHLDGYVGWTAYKPMNDHITSYTVLCETTDVDEARHELLTERHGDDVVEHKRRNCSVCWDTDPSLI